MINLICILSSLSKEVKEKPTYLTKCKLLEPNGKLVIHTQHFGRVNIGCGRAEERILLTGLHAVADIYCNSCRTTLGWKYASFYMLA